MWRYRGKNKNKTKHRGKDISRSRWPAARHYDWPVGMVASWSRDSANKGLWANFATFHELKISGFYVFKCLKRIKRMIFCDMCKLCKI